MLNQPMSSPMIKTMFGLCCALASAPVSITPTNRATRMRHTPLLNRSFLFSSLTSESSWPRSCGVSDRCKPLGHQDDVPSRHLLKIGAFHAEWHTHRDSKPQDGFHS